MTTTGERLRSLRELRGQSQEEIANLIGVGRTTYLKYESGENKPTRKLKELSSLFNVTSDYIMGLSDNPHGKPFAGQDGEHFLLFAGQQVAGYKIPVLGTVAAGQPIFADGNVVGYEYLENKYQNDGYKYYALRIRGDSMTPTIMNGDTVIVRQQYTCDSGQIAIVLVDCEDATAKEVRIQDNGITLIGHNVAVYTPHFYSKQDVDSGKIRVIGLVVETRRKLI